MMNNQEAIKVLDSMKVKIDIPKAIKSQYQKNEALDMGIEALYERDIARNIATILENEQDMRVILQNAEPKRPKGEWINGDPICPCCGENKFKDLDADVWSDWQPNYCPNCGAKMVNVDMRGKE